MRGVAISARRAIRFLHHTEGYLFACGGGEGENALAFGYGKYLVEAVACHAPAALEKPGHVAGSLALAGDSEGSAVGSPLDIVGEEDDVI